MKEVIYLSQSYNRISESSSEAIYKNCYIIAINMEPNIERLFRCDIAIKIDTVGNEIKIEKCKYGVKNSLYTLSKLFEFAHRNCY